MRDKELHYPMIARETLQRDYDNAIKTRNLAHDPDAVRLTNAMHEDLTEYDRRDLVTKYNITLDAFGNYILTEADAYRLMINSMQQAAAALLESFTWYAEHDSGPSDDGTDYMHAIADQISYLSSQINSDDFEAPVDTLTRILNSTRDEADLDENAMGFILGYADHYTDISALMLANNEDLD